MISGEATAHRPGVPAGAPIRRGIGILGATGYSGMELLRLLGGHPHADVRAVGSRQHAGERLDAVWPALGRNRLVLDEDPTHPRVWLDRGVEVVFAALPQGALAGRAGVFLDAGVRLIDLSADFRLRDALEYGRLYGREHPAPALLSEAVYGLTEWCDGNLRTTRLVANPGCYATAILLALLPAVESGWWNGAPIVVTAMSGVSGAGRGPSLTTHFVECANGASPYRVAEEHAHLGEIRQALAAMRPERQALGRGADSPGVALPILFNPVLVPMTRGILVCAAVPLATRASEEELQAVYEARYAAQPCVRVLPRPGLPETRHLRGANRCDVAVRAGASGTMLLVYAAIDNLVKGAAGQAIQNWNRMEAWPETTGLPLEGWGCG